MKRESEVWAKLKAALPAEVMAKRIEDASGDLGTWDTWLGCRGWGMWIELKHTETVNRKPKQRPGQYAFGARLSEAKVSGCYIVGSSDGKVRIINQLWYGDDWKEYLIETWDEMSEANVRGLLERFGLFMA